MNDEYNLELESLNKSLNEAIDIKWLTKNELINQETIVHMILENLHSMKKELQKNTDISNAFSTLRKYMPDIFEIVLEAINKGKKGESK